MVRKQVIELVKKQMGILSPVKGVFQRLMDAVTAIGLGIVASAAFKFLHDQRFLKS